MSENKTKPNGYLINMMKQMLNLKGIKINALTNTLKTKLLDFNI